MKYIISGLAPGKGGVPKLLEYLQDFSSENFKLITPPNLKVKNQYLNYYLQLLMLRIFRIVLLLFRRKNIVLIHFQSIGLRTTKYLIKNNSCYLYLVDNTFFCLKSYNNRENKECLDCLYDNSKSTTNNCKPLNYNYTNKEYLDFYKFLKENYSKLNFLTLSDTQSKLLNKFINKEISVKSLYFLTDDFDEQNKNKEAKGIPKYDLVFHGSNHPAKGHKYILDLAKHLPKYTFLFPFNNKEFFLADKVLNNVTFKSMKWETGLKESVQEAKIVFTPSLWSNTPEAATIKSIIENGNVAMLNTEFGFVNELEGYVLCLTGDIKTDIDLVYSYLKENKKILNIKKSDVFINKYIEKANDFKTFFEITKN